MANQKVMNQNKPCPPDCAYLVTYGSCGYSQKNRGQSRRCPAGPDCTKYKPMPIEDRIREAKKGYDSSTPMIWGDAK